MSGFQIVHRYAYVVLPADGEAFVVFPQEARYVGEHGTTPLEQLFHPRPGELIADRARDAGWRRVGVFGLDYIMTVRDFTALDGARARAVRRRVRPRARGEERGGARLGARLGADQPARDGALGRALRARQDRGRGDGGVRGVLRRRGLRPADDEHGADRSRALRGSRYPEFKIARKEEILGDFMLPSLEIAGPGMHWVEVSRAVAAAGTTLSPATPSAMMDAYLEYYEVARTARCARVRRATTSTPRSPRASTIAASTSATSPGTRSA